MAAAAIAAGSGALVALDEPLLAPGVVLGLGYLAFVLARPEASALGLIAALWVARLGLCPHPVRTNADDRYFTDAFQNISGDGYTGRSSSS